MGQQSYGECETPQGRLRRLELQACEERDRRGYVKLPQQREEAHLWEAEEAWAME